MTSMNNKEEHLEEEQPPAKKSQIGDSKGPQHRDGNDGPNGMNADEEELGTSTTTMDLPHKMSSKPKPKLHDDILIMMVEKVFFQKPEGDGNDAIDFRYGNPYTFFMAHKPITETAFITQFAKLRRVKFENYGERTIEFYKNEEESTVVDQNGLFTGPWRVSNMLLEEIIRRKKFRATNVSTRWYLQNRDACELGTNASSLEAFCILFLGKKLDIADSMKNDYDLAIKKLEMREYPADIKKNCDAIHAINSKELEIEASSDDFFSVCCSSLSRNQILYIEKKVGRNSILIQTLKWN